MSLIAPLMLLLRRTQSHPECREKDRNSAVVCLPRLEFLQGVTQGGGRPNGCL